MSCESRQEINVYHRRGNAARSLLSASSSVAVHRQRHPVQLPTPLPGAESHAEVGRARQQHSRSFGSRRRPIALSPVGLFRRHPQGVQRASQLLRDAAAVLQRVARRQERLRFARRHETPKVPANPPPSLFPPSLTASSLSAEHLSLSPRREHIASHDRRRSVARVRLVRRHRRRAYREPGRWCQLAGNHV